MIVGDAAGRPRQDFSGRLSFSWPKTAAQFALNRNQAGYDPLFPFGYGLSYAKPGKVGLLGEVPGIDGTPVNKNRYYVDGRVQKPFALQVDPTVTRVPVDSAVRQEGAMQLSWRSAAGRATIDGQDIDLGFETNADMMLQMTYRVDRPASDKVTLAMGWGTVDVTDLLRSSEGWKTARIPLKCFAQRGGGDMSHVHPAWSLATTGPLTISIANVELTTQAPGGFCPPLN